MAHYRGRPSPTRLRNLALVFCEKSLLRASGVGCGRLVPHYNAPTSYDRHAAIAYLRAESLQLSADYDLLLREFKALFEGPFEPDAHQTWRQKLRQFRGLLANHRLAWLLRGFGHAHRFPRHHGQRILISPFTSGVTDELLGLIVIAAPGRTRRGTCTVT
jgi:hypothetical protein